MYQAWAQGAWFSHAGSGLAARSREATCHETARGLGVITDVTVAGSRQRPMARLNYTDSCYVDILHCAPVIYVCKEIGDFKMNYVELGWSGSSSGREVGYQEGGPGFESQSGPSQFSIAPLCPPSTKWVARSIKIRQK
ncbi:hypothetical protein PoB_001825900 [Plakobranchus ocellatus]|uniref:Uncharacterized protein n=1 Tax=Plakobranchus ocellatus TaxID=259542 RepID=A0AAV3Z8V4_9GAST|nr:hypothetical protein PoB_001825900 [Plakobranchus ocellatus]